MPQPKKKPKFGRIYKKYNTGADGTRVEHSTWTVRFKGKDYATGEAEWSAANRFLMKLASDDEQRKLRKSRGAAGTTVGDLLDDLSDDYREQGRKTIADCESKIRLYLRPLLGDIPAADFGTVDVKSYIRHRQSADPKPANATINREMALLKHAFNLGFRHHPPKVERVPSFRMLPEDNARKGFITPDQYRKLLDSMPSYLRPLLVVGYHVGNRRSELTQLKWDDVHLDDKNPHFILWAGTTKNKEGRTIPIYGDMITAFHELQAERRKWPTMPYVFHRNGRRIYTWYKAWKSACEDAGLGGLLFHDLRRSAVRNLTRAGVPKVVAKKITGHKTDSVFDRYDIVDESDLADAAERMSAFLGAAK